MCRKREKFRFFFVVPVFVLVESAFEDSSSQVFCMSQSVTRNCAMLVSVFALIISKSEISAQPDRDDCHVWPLFHYSFAKTYIHPLGYELRKTEDALLFATDKLCSMKQNMLVKVDNFVFSVIA